MIRKIDTDVLVLAISIFHVVSVDHLWMAFGTGKNFRYLPIHEIAMKLGSDRCRALPLFHAITGCDTGNYYNLFFWQFMHIFAPYINCSNVSLYSVILRRTREKDCMANLELVSRSDTCVGKPDSIPANVE
jgi:hypothetical protein